MRFFLALAFLVAAVSAYFVLAAVPSSVPVIVNTTAINGVQIANASVARATGKLEVL